MPVPVIMDWTFQFYISTIVISGAFYAVAPGMVFQFYRSAIIITKSSTFSI